MKPIENYSYKRGSGSSPVFANRGQGLVPQWCAERPPGSSEFGDSPTGIAGILVVCWSHRPEVKGNWKVGGARAVSGSRWKLEAGSQGARDQGPMVAEAEAELAAPATLPLPVTGPKNL
ncbi:hypothetical protein SEVIR_1G269350v4 [Setaria viridis]|uniref:Uncharacterized protein n=1 Tax=Setaria viridis TaxID=4556 RepID=A0A4U6WDE7_SETVI|nr:hypothetical protein SEVIR_1G269350v2 [Setaria viridis]